MITITIEQIQYFLAIKEFNGFSNAANELCISQSSLSKQIKSLENELDTKLFERTSRVIKLTPAGEDFFMYAQKFLDDYNNIFTKMKKHSLSNKNKLNIGTIAVLTQYGLTSTLAKFKSKYPQVDLHILEDENDAVLNMLENSKIDLAIVRDFNLSKDLFNVIHLADDKLVVVTSSSNLGITLMANNVLKPFKNLNITVHPLKGKINSSLALVSNKFKSEKNEIFHVLIIFLLLLLL